MMAAWRCARHHLRSGSSLGTGARSSRQRSSDRITVVDRRSSELVTGVGIAERAEVLVTEVFSSGLIHEGVLPTVEHAHQHLLTRNAIVIPAAASAMGYLI